MNSDEPIKADADLLQMISERNEAIFALRKENERLKDELNKLRSQFAETIAEKNTQIWLLEGNDNPREEEEE